jgi:hypothetical protein
MGLREAFSNFIDDIRDRQFASKASYESLAGQLKRATIERDALIRQREDVQRLLDVYQKELAAYQASGAKLPEQPPVVLESNVIPIYTQPKRKPLPVDPYEVEVLEAVADRWELETSDPDGILMWYSKWARVESVDAERDALLGIAASSLKRLAYLNKQLREGVGSANS